MQAMDIRRNITLIVGISIPILMILFVAGSIYLPGVFAKPKFNFLYITGDYYSGSQYSVINGRLVENEIEYPPRKYGPPRAEVKLFVHDVAKNESKIISFEEAQMLNLDSSIKSPDGFEVISGGRGSGIFFFFGVDRDYDSIYLKGHNMSKKLNVQMSGSYGYGNFRFLGWIR